MIVSRARLGRALIGTTVSIVCLVFLLRDIDIDATAEVLKTASAAWIGVVVASLLADILIRALRWQVLVSPVRRVPYRPMLQYLLIGYLANNLLPLRLGEFVRAHYLGDREGISGSTALGTVVVERVVDFAVLVTLASLAIVVLHVRGIVASTVLIGLAIAGLLVTALAVAVAAHRLPGADRIARRLERWPQVRGMATRLHGGLSVVTRPRTLVESIVLSCAAWLTTVVAFAAAGHAVGVELTWAEAALAAAGVNLATAIPSGPGYFGTFELAAVGILAVFGVAGSDGLAVALIVHVTSLVLTSVGGGIAFAHLGWRRPAVTIVPADAAS